MLWVKSFHIVFMVTWFAGLFYLPRLFVYHAMTDDQAGKDRFKTMERKLYFGILAPGAILTVVLGLWLWLDNLERFAQAWFYWKLGLVALLIGYHLWCGKLVQDFKQDINRHSHVFYR